MTIATIRHNRHFGMPRLPWLALFCLFLCGYLPVTWAGETLTNASAVLSLSVDQASSGLPVSVVGVVTAAEPSWTGRFFVQDPSGGIFVQLITNRQLVPGDIVHVEGVSSKGKYAPVISRPHWVKLGTAPLPKAKHVSAERLMSGAEDSQRVEVSGIVRTAEPSGGRIGIQIASGGYRFRAVFPPSPDVDPQSLVGARVLVRGTAGATFNHGLDLRQSIINVTLFVPEATDIIVEQAAPANPFGKPLAPLNSIAQYQHDPPLGYQVHVKGVVTYQRKGESIFLHDATGGLEVQTTSTNDVTPGETVEAVGFPAVANFLPVLEDAVFRKTADPRSNLEPTNTTVADLLKGLHHADFVLLRGRLIERLVAGIGTDVNGAGIRTTLILQSSNAVFAAEKETSEANTFLSGIPIGSLIEARGICLLDGNGDGTIKSFRLLLPTSHDVQVIERPSWLTPQHLLMSLVSLFAVLIVAVGWTIWVSNKNSILKSLVREKESAQMELQQAHDQLEERVKERTAQLKVEMTARKESELQFRAVLTERTRLAQELHDTLEQTLTGIALQQDLVANQFAKNPDRATHHLKLARNLMRQSQVDLHRSVWGLRSRADEEFNFTNALITSVRQITGDTGVRLETETVGEAGPLSEIIEENLLRIGQEAVTNAVKHAGASAVKIELHFTPQQVILQIHDDGKGFDPETCTGPKDGHFGLLGIKERTERMGGQVQITSAPHSGTTIRVEIPAQPQNGNGAHHGDRTMATPKRHYPATARPHEEKTPKSAVLVADDHYVVRMGVTAIINNEPDMEVVAEAANGTQAVGMYRQHQPDLVLLDSRMPLKSGVQAAQEIRQSNGAARIVMLTAFDGDEDIHKALTAGAQGYILKNATGEQLIPALRAVAAGREWIPAEVASRLAKRKEFEVLTPRELEVLHELAKGLANKQIADVMSISQHTTKGYLKNILTKLHVADRTEAVTVAIQRGLIHL